MDGLESGRRENPQGQSKHFHFLSGVIVSVTRGFRSKSARKVKKSRKGPLKSANFANLLKNNCTKKFARDLQNPQVLRKTTKSGHPGDSPGEIRFV